MQEQRKEQQQQKRQLEAPWTFFGASLRDIHQNLGTSCIATLNNATIYRGKLYSVDPETKTLLLLMIAEVPKEDTPANKPGIKMVAVRYHALKDFVFGTVLDMTRSAYVSMMVPYCKTRQTDLSDSNVNVFLDESSQGRLSVKEMDALVNISSLDSSGLDLDGRKSALVALLKSKRIPVESQADDPIVHIMGSAHVRPPYVALSIECANMVMRERVRAMVQELPGIMPKARALEDEDSTSTRGSE